AVLTRHLDWEAFEAWRSSDKRALTLLTTKSTVPYVSHQFGHPEVLLFGSESSGVPAHVHHAADTRLTIPMRPDARSLNLAVSVGIVTAEAARQLRWL
ncbi:MAG: TrmH family RNA methyltransferase, partial [Pseudomonadota bacterium]